MKLMTKEIRKEFEGHKIGSSDGKFPKKVIVKYFTPWSNWIWYGTEFDGEDQFFGYVESGIDPSFSEWGYFSLSELESIQPSKDTFFLKIERDLHFSGSLNEKGKVI